MGKEAKKILKAMGQSVFNISWVVCGVFFYYSVGFFSMGAALVCLVIPMWASPLRLISSAGWCKQQLVHPGFVLVGH